MPDDKRIRFHQLLELHLNNVLKTFVNEPLTPELMGSIRGTFRDKIKTVFEKSSHKLSAAALTWLADQHFKSISLGPDQNMSDNVVINEYTLAELEFRDIQLLRNLFLETKMGHELDDEFRRRSVS